MSDTGASLAKLKQLWLAVASCSDESGDAAASLGYGFRQALRTDGATPRPGSATVLELLLDLLTQSGDAGSGGPGENDESATKATARVVDAIGWELFDGLVVHLPVSLRRAIQPFHIHCTATRYKSYNLLFLHAQVRAPLPRQGNLHEVENEKQLAWSCAAQVLRHCGHGPELRLLATVPGFGSAVGWKQALGAVNLCTQALRPVSASDVVRGDVATAAHEDDLWKSRLKLCAASLPLVLQLVDRAERQQRNAEESDEEEEDSDSDSGSGDSFDFDTINTVTAVEEAAQLAADQDRELRICTARLDAVSAMVDYAEHELIDGFQLRDARGSSTGSDHRAGIWWMIGQFAVRLLTSVSKVAAETAVSVLLCSSSEFDKDLNPASSSFQYQEHQLQSEWRWVQSRIVEMLFIVADAATVTVVAHAGDILLPPPPPLGRCLMASVSCDTIVSSMCATGKHWIGRSQDYHENVEVAESESANDGGGNGSDAGKVASVTVLEQLKMALTSKSSGQKIIPWIEAAIKMDESTEQLPHQQGLTAAGRESMEEARVRRAALVVACHCHGRGHGSSRPLLGLVPSAMLVTPQRRLIGMMPLLSSTFYSSDREDLIVGQWQTVAERLLNHLLSPPVVHGNTYSQLPLHQPQTLAGLSPALGSRLQLRQFDADCGGAVVRLLHSLLIRCTGSDAQSRLTPKDATKQLKVFENVLAKGCAVEDQLWLLPAILLRAAASSEMTLNSVLVIQRLVLRACTAAVREIKRNHARHATQADGIGQTDAMQIGATASDTQLRFHLLESRVLALDSLVAHCLAANARGGLGGQQNQDTCAFDCAAFLRSADMIVGALSILRIVTAYKQWAADAHAGDDIDHTRDQDGGKLHTSERLKSQVADGQSENTAVASSIGSSTSRLVAGSALPSVALVSVPVSVLLGALRLRVETYQVALARLEQQGELAGTSSSTDSSYMHLGIGSMESISQAVTTLQMVTQAIDAASEQQQRQRQQ